jgi:uncharacterized membrane protein
MRVTAVAGGSAWGWLPVVSVVDALGLCVVAVAYAGARVNAIWGDPVFWVGILLLFVPAAIRVLSPTVSQGERIGMLVMLGIALYLVKVFQYPLTAGADFDELRHLRTAEDIARLHQLFQPNPILTVSPSYPGLEIVENAISGLTGIPLFYAGMLVIGVARLLLVVALYLFFARVSGSAQIAGIATLLYMANPNFLYFGAALAYESLALPLAVVVLLAVALRWRAPPALNWSLTPIICLLLGAVVITHHVTSYVLVLFLLVWTALSMVLSRRPWQRTGPGGPALLGLAMVVAWTIFTGGAVVNYISDVLEDALLELLQILGGQTAPRRLFQDGAGVVAPLWERVMSYASVGLILVGILVGLPLIWRRYRTSAVALALTGLAISYPAAQAVRLTHAGGIVSDRTMEFNFWGIAFVMAVGITGYIVAAAPSWWRMGTTVSAMTIVFIGGILLGGGSAWNRMPGPYLVAADARSITPESQMVAAWLAQHIASRDWIGTDRTNGLLIGAEGRLRPTTDEINDEVARVFTSTQFGDEEQHILQVKHIQYLVVDRRLSTGLPRIGFYFSQREPNAFHYHAPIEAAALAKFDHAPEMDRLYDSGNIIVYQYTYQYTAGG